MNCLNVKTLVILFFVAISFGNLKAQPTAPSGKKWQKVANLSDEFDYWDGKKWEKSLWNYDAPVNMITENSGVANGYLYVRATLGSGARWFNTSRIKSIESIRYPMYTECRMRAAHLSAFSTFWLNNGDAYNRDEIDICESNPNPTWPNQSWRPYTLYSQYFVVQNGVTERNDCNFDNRKLSNTNPGKSLLGVICFHSVKILSIFEL